MTVSDIVVATPRTAFRSTAEEAPEGARVPVELRVTVSDPFSAYRRVRSEDGDGFFYETTGGQPGWGAFGVDPVERLRVGSEAVSRRDAPDATRGRDADERSSAGRQTQPDDVAEGTSASSRTESDDVDETQGVSSANQNAKRSGDASASPSLSALDAVLDSETLVRGDTGCDVPYPCGLFGWLSYDVARELESLPGETTDDRNIPRLRLGLFDRVATWTEPRTDDECTLRITACPRVPAASDDDALDDLFDDAVARATDLAEATLSAETALSDPPVRADEAEFESDCGREAFAERVRTVKRHIREGDTFQANVSQRLVAPAAVHSVAAYDALRRVNPAPYSGLVEFREADLVSASPELLLRVDGDRLVTEPIAGTRPRGATPSEDDELELDLTADEKERAEHAMLVDLERNDVGKVSEYGSVEVSEYRRVDRYSEVMHLVSVVEGTRRPDVSIADAVAAVFPGGTITGAPKPRTMEIIDDVETTRRGPYTGSMAAFGFDDRATLNIVIRTLVRHDDEYHLRVGAGIVHDSDPDAEYDETLAKGKALVTAIDEAFAADGRGMGLADSEVDST